MSFIKYARLPIVKMLDGKFVDGKLVFNKTAATDSDDMSIYKSDKATINVQALLDMTAKEYDISVNPQDYIFEAARAVTAEEPNFNGDAFPREELLRFDHRLSKAIYQTFIGKPHHINHRADDPKTSRGVVLDASYNDLTPPLESCPSCNNRTAEAEGRDKTGIHCAKCGSTVKDEFVELLIAIDTKKDPTFAEGVRSGALDSLSMGCFIPGTQVRMADGSNKNIELIKTGEHVLTHTGSIAEVDELSIRNFSGEILTVSAAGTTEPIVVTPNHPFWVINQESNSGEWIHAEHLTKGMYVVSPKTSLSEVSVDLKIARLAGYFASEGNFIKAYDGANIGKRVGVEFTFNISETKYLDEVQNLLSSLGYDPNRYERPDRNIAIVKAYRCEPLASRLYELIGEHAHTKHLSNEILAWPKDAQMAFLGACFNGDGHFTEYGDTSRTVYVSVSRDLSDQISQLLIDNDIPNRVQVRRNASGFGSSRPAYDVVISGDAQIKLAGQCDKIRRVLKGTDAMMQSRDSKSGTVRLVKGVTRSQYDGPVYNFEVKHNDHSYIAGGVAVHNCEAGYTDCSICDNRARTVSQFCQHIKSGNKKKQFKTASGPRMSFEKCGEVIFTEISRVDQPADPTAKQSEVLSINHMPMAAESEMLVMACRMAKLEQIVAQTVVDPFPDLPNRQQVIEHLQQEMETIAERCKGKPTPADAIRLKSFSSIIKNLRELDEMDRQRQGQFEDSSPQVPFKTVAESIKWAESSANKLKAEVHRLSAEKEQKYKDASTSGRPFYAWENATYDSQIKAHRQYIARLEDYAVKARMLEASGQPWGKSLTRSMSRFFASKEAQEMRNDISKDLEVLAPGLPPDLVQNVQNLLDDGDSVPKPMSIDDYVKKHEDSKNQHLTPAEMGISVDETGGLPTTMASKNFESRIASDLDALVDAVKENKVSAEIKAFKFANSYKDLEATVTKSGNVRVHTPKGTLFVIRPEVKPADKAAAEKLGSEILAHIANEGIVSTVAKYQTVLGPKMAQVLEFHVEDHQDGRENGDKKSVTEGGDGDGQLQHRESPEKSQVGEEHTDRKDMAREQRDQGNSSILENHSPDHKEKYPDGYKPAIDEEHSDKAEAREKKTLKDHVIDNIILDHKEKAADGKIKTAAEDKKEWEKPWEKKEEGKEEDKSEKKDEDKKAQLAAPAAAPQLAACAMAGCAGKPPHEMHAEGTCHECKKPMLECACKMAQAPAMPGMSPPPPPAQTGSGGMAPMAAVDGTEKTAGRIERLYKNRLNKASEEASKKVADAEKVATQKVAAKLLRTLKLAAKRQALNMEFSPLKATMCDVLTNRLDIDSESYYPGMDPITATSIVEATTQTGLDQFVESLVKRASELMSMSNETLDAIEADIKNLQVAPLSVPKMARKASADNAVRQAAINGNLALAPSPTDETISNTGNRDTIRSALGTTKVHRASQALLKR